MNDLGYGTLVRIYRLVFIMGVHFLSCTIPILKQAIITTNVMQICETVKCGHESLETWN
jgi:hypothetical protein